MTRSEALAEARRRWGCDGLVKYDRLYHEYRVGILMAATGPGGVEGRGFCDKGTGSSYMAAFADADRRAK